MIIAGGTYREQVDSTGYREDIAGSGLRGANLLAGSGVELVTAVEDDAATLLEGTAAVLGITVRNSRRDRAVGFHYRASFIEPTLHGRSASLLSSQHIEGDQALVFGIVERGNRAISAQSVVYDPQSTDDVLIRGKSPCWGSGTRAAVCANALETHAFVGDNRDTEAAAREMATMLSADVLVTKAGARGCLVTEPQTERQTWIGAHPTAAVTKVGSGDVFSAAFAHAWHGGADAIDAARFASATTAWWCGGNGLQLSAAALGGESPKPGSPELTNGGRSPLIYLAGPFFSTEQRWLIDQCKSFLESAGARVFSPIHDVGPGGLEVAFADLDGLERCDAVFAVLEGWDPGTLFEVGWATARAIPVVVAGGGGGNEEAFTMVLGTGADRYADFATAMYHAIWRGLGVGPA